MSEKIFEFSDEQRFEIVRMAISRAISEMEEPGQGLSEPKVTKYAKAIAQLLLPDSSPSLAVKGTEWSSHDVSDMRTFVADIGYVDRETTSKRGIVVLCSEPHESNKMTGQEVVRTERTDSDSGRGLDLLRTCAHHRGYRAKITMRYEKSGNNRKVRILHAVEILGDVPHIDPLDADEVEWEKLSLHRSKMEKASA